MKLTSQQVNTICKGDQEIAGYFNALLAVVDKQEKQIEKLEKRVSELERQLGQNSNNSSKPPSSDGLRKPTNLRTPGGKRGAPKGHDGHTLRFAVPDEVVIHSVTNCGRCAHSLVDVSAESTEKRQVFDLPPPRVIVTEHRIEKKCCPRCGLMQQGLFPDRVNAPTQYGEGFTAWTAYLHGYQMLPLARIAQLFEDLTSYRPSEATLLSYLKSISDSLAPVEDEIRKQLFTEPVVHADESGLRIEGKGHWIHTVSSSQWTLLGIQKNRGCQGIDELGFLPAYNGIVVHDCYKSYFKDHYSFEHVLCNAHLLRECQGIEQYDKHQWATQMKNLLLESWTLAKSSRLDNIRLSDKVIQDIHARYDDILEFGKSEWVKDVVREKTGVCGRKIKSRAANLGERFTLHKEAILRFIYDGNVPFDNNQAERDIRMIKVKQKVSGCFRTLAGAHKFARIRSVVSTLLKQNRPVLSSLISALRGQLSF
jgi:transposase